MTLVAALSLAAGYARAQIANTDVATYSGYINPFPPGDNYRVQVYGDWMAESLLPALAETLQTEPRVQVLRKPRTFVPLVRFEHEEEIRVEEQARDNIQIGVILLGISDRTNFRAAPSTPVLRLGTEAWQAEYGRRVDRLIKTLKRRGIALYVIGQPPLRREEADTDAKMLSEILRDKAFVNGVRYIDIHPSFVDEGGDYTQYGPDYAGNNQKLRESDGVSMSWAGNRKIAALVDKEIRKDLAVALAERAVPLAGAEAEQRRINPDKPYQPAQRAPATPAAAKDAKAQPASTAPSALTPQPALVRQPTAIVDQKSESARLTLRIPGAAGRDETIVTDIVRPPISAATLTLLKRKEVSQNAAPSFDTIAAELADGTTLSMFVAPLQGATPARGAASTGSETYNAVWVRGDRLPSKPGRADDFRWPPPDDVPYAPPPPKPETARGQPTAPAATPATLKRSNPSANVPRAKLQNND